MSSELIQYTLLPTKDHELTAKVKIGSDPAFHLHSRVDPWYEAREWCKQVNLIEGGIYLIRGSGLAYHIKALLNQLLPNSYIVVLATPTEEAILKTIRRMPGMEWLEDTRLTFLHLLPMRDIAIAVADIMIAKMVKKIQVYSHYPAVRLAEDEYQELEEPKMVALIEQVMMLNFNVTLTTNHVFFTNYWLNFSDIVTRPGISRLANSFQDVPFIIVAAGPSLDKNIQRLQQCKDKAVIVAAGTAIGALHKYGIIPDFLMITDAHETMYEVTHKYFHPDTVLVAATTAQHKVVANYPGTICFFRSESDLSEPFISLLPATMTAKLTISVATAAVKFAEYCGAKTITFVGQDLSFPTGSDQQHADGIVTRRYDRLERITVPGYYGDEVETDYSLKMVIDFFALHVSSNLQIDYINATEGGAYLAGMRQMTLAEVYDTVLIQDCRKYKTKMNALTQYTANRKTKMRLVKELSRIFAGVQDISSSIENTFKQELMEREQGIYQYKASVLNKFQHFFYTLSRFSAYSWIQTIVNPPMALLKFQMADGISVEQQYEYYVEITADLRNFLYKFMDTLQINMKNIEKHG